MKNLKYNNALPMILSTCLLAAPLAFASDDATEDAPSKAPSRADTPITQAERVSLLPTAGSMLVFLDQRSEQPLKVSALEDSTALYGFSGGVSKTGGSFQLGQLMATLDAQLRNGQVSEAQDSLTQLEQRLSAFGASPALIAATAELGQALKNSQDGQAIDPIGLAVLRPFLEDFVVQEGRLAYLRLGEWTQAIQIALDTGDQEALTTMLSMSDRYLEVMAEEPELPESLADLISRYQEIGSLSNLGARDLDAVRDNTQKLVTLLG